MKKHIKLIDYTGYVQQNFFMIAGYKNIVEKFSTEIFFDNIIERLKLPRFFYGVINKKRSYTILKVDFKKYNNNFLSALKSLQT